MLVSKKAAKRVGNGIGFARTARRRPINFDARIRGSVRGKGEGEQLDRAKGECKVKRAKIRERSAKKKVERGQLKEGSKDVREQ
jgi:hypothetical protein